ncbi:unnamed protein product [Heligmosomoides polygyrus]|uniref:Uncharacterized protein n=1 Tax=Heligmosomoides polygyrus TaxID=6339 RepID=A0A3P8EDW4_HELPZ|nr:unnamed protein product [Heligmosomoides polygyrus]
MKYDPDDPSTFPPEEKKRTSKKEIKKKTKKEDKKKKTGSIIKSVVAPVLPMREANDLETVNGMVSNWGAVQPQMAVPLSERQKIP